MSQQKQKPAHPRQQRVTVQSKTLPDNAKPQEKLPVRPAHDDRKGWKTHWEAHQQPWRTEPEIDMARQQELATFYAVSPDIKQGIYPFQGINLSRADVEWLLAAYGDKLTPKKGLDVRGANLNGMDLSGLPLRGLCGGLSYDDKQHKTAAVKMNNVNLNGAQLEGADLRCAQLEGVHLTGAKLQGADFKWAHLKGADLFGVQFQGADPLGAHLKGADLLGIQLEGADLSEVQLQGVDLSGARLLGAQLSGAHLQAANLQGAQLTGAHLKGTQLQSAHLQGANLTKAHLQGANLFGAQLQGTYLSEAQLQGAQFREAQLQGTYLYNVILADPKGIGPGLADAQWDGTNLAVVDWSQVKILGDEHIAQQSKHQDGKVKDKKWRLDEYRTAVRANRQLSVALQSQGLNEEAAHFAYRANGLQRKVLWFQMVQPKTSFWQRLRKLGSWGFSHLLNALTGYGYRPGRSAFAYLLIVFGFMGLYLLTSQFATPHLSWDEALVLSLSSFHGRGFFTQTITLGDPYARLAVSEAVLGLLVEVSLIATFTQRFFGK